MQRGKLIVLEGPDGVGKSSIASALVSKVNTLDTGVIGYSFPGKEPGTLGELIYHIHHGDLLSKVPAHAACVQTLHIAAHIDAIHRVIIPALRRGTLVVLDRFWWSTWVYGVSNGISETLLDHLIEVEKQVWDDVQPDLLIVLSRSESLKQDEDAEVWYERVKLYERLAKREENTYPVRGVLNESSLNETLVAVMHELSAAGVLNF